MLGPEVDWAYRFLFCVFMSGMLIRRFNHIRGLFSMLRQGYINHNENNIRKMDYTKAMSNDEIEFVKVSTLKPSLRNVNVTVRVVGVGESRQITSRRSHSVHSVAEALVGDETGCVVLNLWDDQIKAFDKNDVVQIK
ncbi:MAG: hypothetical protein GWN64_07310, partial [Candidatus Thorarchaeota archaeon]|nr:hypothetical protein [Candidatus Thorarchaeota archaeon]